MSIVLHNVPPKAGELIRHQASAIQRMKETAKEQADDAINTVEVAGAAYVVGFIEGRYPDKAEIEGVPLGVAVALAAYVMSFWSGKSYAGHLKAVGKGALAAAGHGLGKEMGVDRRTKDTSAGYAANVYPFPHSQQVAGWR